MGADYSGHDAQLLAALPSWRLLPDRDQEDVQRLREAVVGQPVDLP